MSSAAALYDSDFHAWAEEQAAALRSVASERPNLPLDLAHLIEEVEDLGRREREAVFSLAKAILRHLLLLHASATADRACGWREEVAVHRVRLRRRLSPSLRRYLEEQLGEIYADARHLALRKLRLHGEDEAVARLPGSPPWTLDEILSDDEPS